MNASDIKDHETLRTWLETRPVADSVIIAHRAALRAAPAWFAMVPQQSDLTELPILRLNLTSGVARKYPTPEVSAAARSSAFSDSAFSSSAADSAADSAAFSAASAARSSAFSAARASAADFAARFSAAAAFSAAISAASAADSAARSAADSAARSAAAAARAAAISAAWEVVQGDCILLEQGEGLQGTGLWHNAPNLFQSEWDETRPRWSAPNSPYAFWLRWYEAALEGRALNPELERDIALIPNDDWEKDPAHIAGLIAALEAKYAKTATNNGERVEFNPETGKVFLVPETDLPDDIATYARRKITRAVQLFGQNPENQYTAIAPDLAMLREAVEDAANLPIEIFDACASASRRLNVRASAGECAFPEKDPLLQDYLQRIREAGADILANDPKTQGVLSRRNEILGNNALIDVKDAAIGASEKLASLSEGLLATSLPRDAALSTNENVPIEERRAASFKLSSRVLRIGAIIAATGGAIAAYPSFIEGSGLIWRDPIVQRLVDAILNYLGM